MKSLKLFFLAAMMIGLASCEKVVGDGPVITELRSVTGFSGVDVRVAADVYVKQDAAYKVEVRAQQNILQVLRTFESNGKLVVRFDNDVRVKSHEPIEIFVSLPSSTLTSLRLSGSGNLKTTGAFQCNSMEMDISGSGSMEVSELTANSIDANISGSGNMKIFTGTIGNERLKISGSGGIDFGGVTAQRATTRTSGSGDTRVNASQHLDVTISGSGSVYYKGNPVIATNISGSGKVLPY